VTNHERGLPGDHPRMSGVDRPLRGSFKVHFSGSEVCSRFAVGLQLRNPLYHWALQTTANLQTFFVNIFGKKYSKGKI
jgi:hypothetical protein